MNMTIPPVSLKNKVKSALDDWHKPNKGKSPLENLYLFRDFLTKTQLNHRRATNEILTMGIRRLEQEQSKYAAYLQQRYIEETSISTLAQHYNVSQPAVYERQRLSIEWLSNVLWDMERSQYQAHKSAMYSRLEPSTYHNLIGVQAHQEHIIEKLSSSDSVYILLLTGMGGIGKTSLADSTVRRIVDEGQFSAIGWVTARQQQLTFMAQIEHTNETANRTEKVVRELCLQLMPDFPLPPTFSLQEATNALEAHLRTQPHLIVIDNLETLEDIRLLLPLLQRLANPSKFLVTSRERLHGHPNLYYYDVPALSIEDALTLVRQEAERLNLAHIVNNENDELQPIYETVGGNPLALRLVAGLAYYDPVDEILADLQQANNDTAEQLYTYLYRQAWDKLNTTEKQVFLTMFMLHASGDKLEIVVENSGLPKHQVRTAMRTLANFNLVNVQTDMHTSHYSVHSLTRSFLREQALLWQ
ncbi:MAG: NB-ARC domain-containing protein [Chloroflexota bacterium]